MKNVKIDEKSKFLSAVLLSILLVGIAFFFGYKKLEEKANTLNAENTSLENRIKSLEAYYLTEEQNKKDTETMTAEIKDIFSHYAGEVRYEDGIYEAFNLRGGSDNTFTLESIGFSGNTSIKRISSETVNAAQIEGFDKEISFNKFDVSYIGNITYEGLKSMVREIANGDYNLAIGQMSYSILPSGDIEGSALLSFYSVTGAGCPYTEPPVSSYDTGIDNLFGVNPIVETDEEED